MAGKSSRHPQVPLTEEEISDLWSFPPIRIAKTRSPEVPGQPRRSRYENRNLQEQNIAYHENSSKDDISEDSVPPSSIQLRSSTGAGAGYESVQRSNNKRTNIFDDLEEPPTKKACISGVDKIATALEDVAVAIKASLDKASAEAREDRREINNTLKALIQELKKKDRIVSGHFRNLEGLRMTQSDKFVRGIKSKSWDKIKKDMKGKQGSVRQYESKIKLACLWGNVTEGRLEH
ncbi:hypothetical protein BDN70DRAFT_898448 [Pholiota conissans]|uniref:Uncharacterized protein n=1 Tax=Pholiota conissans TaxID=109636 RepID=A0A9P6CPU0_9AGAR|nr:hypothetical protein BDN70DRAFT_898448 [Pholiota conissans]